MQIRKVSEPFKHLSGNKAVKVTIADFENEFKGGSAKVTPISDAAKYQGNDKEASSARR